MRNQLKIIPFVCSNFSKIKEVYPDLEIMFPRKLGQRGVVVGYDKTKGLLVVEGQYLVMDDVDIRVVNKVEVISSDHNFSFTNEERAMLMTTLQLLAEQQREEGWIANSQNQRLKANDCFLWANRLIELADKVKGITGG